MNGAHSLVSTLINGGVDTCFANPGTSEMHFVAALDQVPGIKCVLGLQENVVTGMADGYFRLARKPAATLLHCGPGLANGLANLHNAKRARSAILNIVGDHTASHAQYDPPLNSPTQSLAQSVSGWVKVSSAAKSVGLDAMEGLSYAHRYPGHISTLILPSDVSWNEGGIAQASVSTCAPETQIDAQQVLQVASAIGAGRRVLLLLSGEALFEEAQMLLHSIKSRYPVALLAEYSIARISRGSGRLPIERIPYGIDAAVARLKPFDDIVLINALEPVAFFAYPDKPSRLASPDTRIITLATPEQSGLLVLKMLCEELGVGSQPIPETRSVTELVRGEITQLGFARNLSALLPEGAIVSDESISWGRDFYRNTFAARPHEWLHLTGGAIGDGLPVATGAAVGTRGARRVVSLQADGSAMYSLQALWTQAEQNLPCTTIILKNNKYNILIGEYKSVGAEPGATANKMLSLSSPEIDWVKLAQGMGVEAARADTLERCSDLMKLSFAQRGPFLIELTI
jgi:acetolactate synthase-1/2/3 large subunit